MERFPRNLPKTKEMKRPSYATNSMQGPAKNPMLNVSTDISAGVVENQATDRRTARLNQNEIFGLQPKYLRHNLWTENPTLSPTTVNDLNIPNLYHDPLFLRFQILYLPRPSPNIHIYSKSTLLSRLKYSNTSKIIQIHYLSNLCVTAFENASGHGPIPFLKDSLEHMMNLDPCHQMTRKSVLFVNNAEKRKKKVISLIPLALGNMRGFPRGFVCFIIFSLQLFFLSSQQKKNVQIGKEIAEISSFQI